MKGIFKYIKQYRIQFIVSLLCIVVVSFLVSYTPIVESGIINYLQEVLDKGIAFDPNVILRIVITLIIMYVAIASIRLFYNMLLTTAIQNMMKSIRNDVQAKIHRMPIRYFDNNPIGDVMSRMINDVESLSNGFQQAFAAIFSAVLQITLIIVLMFVAVTWQFGLIALAMFPIIFIISKVILKLSGPLYSERFRMYGDLTANLQEQYTGYKEISLFNKQADSEAMFEDLMLNLSEKTFKSDFISGLLNPLIFAVTYITLVVVAVVGGVLSFNSLITFGALHAGIRYIWRLANPITQVTQMSVVVQSSIAAGKRVFDFLNEAEELPDFDPAETVTDLKGHIEFKDVSFSYNKQRQILKHLNFEAKPGEMIAIVGPTGSGKTTIINLLMRFYDVNKGEILLDGVNINHIKKDELRTHFGMVLQDTWLFKGSIADNIKYGYDEATMEEIMEAAKTANIDHYINTLPHGYDMVINEEGDNISQGEKQLLTIARAFLANPAILILDEATSTVDTRLELMLQEAMRKIMEGRTSFVIAHRLSTIRNADKIIVLRDGEIIEMGNHEELIAQQGFYEDLYNSQFEEEE
ncbi:MAG TPA: ABC transporter ATP-binding protein [Haploplasma sp.]|nr:ABC transporter ATP-binding protein [Haploplasma sp.]